MADLTTRQEVMRYFVTDSDCPLIEAFTQKPTQYAVTFRIAGEATVRRLKNGAGAKPHDILEKSVKYPNNAFEKGAPLSAEELLENQRYLRRLGHLVGLQPPQDDHDLMDAEAMRRCREAFDLVCGFVGHWRKKTGPLKGLYLTTYGYETLCGRYGQYIGCIDEDAGIKRYYLRIAPSVEDKGSAGKAGEQKQGAQKPILDVYQLPELGEGWESYFFTGDYDLHDYLQLVGRWNPLVEGTCDYERFIVGMNKALEASAQLPPALRTNPDYQRIQHGAQAGYISFMLNNELMGKDGEPMQSPVIIQNSVARWKLPLAVCTNGGWSILRTQEQHKAFYHEKGLAIKNNWESTEQFEGFMKELAQVYRGKLAGG